MPDSLHCTIMRGGTSKAVFLREADLPPPGEERDRLMLRVFGSPDARQIDGLGGADPLTSKLAIIGKPRVANTDVTYTFGQVEIDRAHVDYKSLCGNISSAVGHYAVEEGLVPVTEPVTRVRAYTTNLSRVLIIEVPVHNGRPLRHGDYRVPGVPGSGARIVLDFADTAGGATGALLPTGNAIDTLEIPGLGAIEASLVDIGNAHVFIRARDVGLIGTESPAELDRDRDLLGRLERIRGAGAARMALASSAEAARDETPATPILGIVSPPQPYRSHLDGDAISAENVDLVSRLMYMQITHKTYAGTSTVCTGVAARLPGTIVAEALRHAAHNRLVIRIGHPAGVIETESELDFSPVIGVRRATFGRTARRIMDGAVYLD